jgi:uncharacterized protein (TIGR03435 family)
LLVTCIVGGGSGGAGQQPPAAPAVFEFVSIRANTNPGDTHVLRVLPGGRLEIRRAQVITLIRFAHGHEQLHARLITGSQPWMYQEYFDIVAANGRDWSPPSSPGDYPPELRPMLLALLEERFGVRAHVQERERGVRALRRIDEGGAPGPHLRPSAATCRGVYAPSGPLAPLPPCPFVQTPESIVMGGSTMADFARALGDLRIVDDVVKDETGLDGLWDVEVTFAPPGRQGGRGAPPLPAALEEQLGLRLQRVQARVPMLIVERARRPVED